MFKLETGHIISNELVANDTYCIRIKSDLHQQLKPGQFVSLQIAGFYLRRPLSIADSDDVSITIYYKVVGEGTKRLAELKKDSEISILGPSGNGFELVTNQSVHLIGGGMGVAPLFKLAKALVANNNQVSVICGFLNPESAYLIKEFEKLGVDLHVVYQSVDQMNVLEYLNAKNITPELIYACGPSGMLRAIQETYPKGYISYESRMACAIGVCNGCVCKDSKEHEKTYKICKDGPVFEFNKVVI